MAKKTNKVTMNTGSKPRVVSTLERGGYRKSTMPVPKDFDRILRSVLFSQHVSPKKKK